MKSVIQLSIIIVSIKLSQAYNFDSDKLILKKHYQNNKGPNLIQIKNLKNNYSARSKRMDKKPSEVIFSVNGLSDEAGGNSGHFQSLFEPEMFFTSSFASKKQKREVSNEPDQIKQTETSKKARSLFTDLIEIPVSKNITFTKPSLVEGFNDDSYKDIFKSIQNYSQDLRPTALTPVLQSENSNLKFNDKSTRVNFKVVNDLYLPGGDFYMYDDQKVLGITDSNTTVFTPLTNVKSNEKESNQNEVFNLLNVNNKANETVEKDNRYSHPMFHKKNNKDVNNWDSHSPVTKQDIINSNHKLKQYLENIKVKGETPLAKEKLKKKYSFITKVGLLKVMSLLTKTFKKIVRQHEEIKKMHKELIFASRDFMEKRKDILKEMKDFNKKSELIASHSNNLANLQLILEEKQGAILKKETELTRKREEFEKLQMKFSMQQQQFYRLQKIVINKNDRIYARQNQITKKQYEISQTQDALVDLVSRSKHVLNEEKLNSQKHITDSGGSRSNSSKVNKNNNGEFIIDFINVTQIEKKEKTNNRSKTNFGFLSRRNRFNNNKEMLKEKDFKDIDDLVYKHYFNNTAIGKVMHGRSNKYNRRETPEANKINGGNDKEHDQINNNLNILEIKKADDSRLDQKNNESLNTFIQTLLTNKPLIRRRRWLDHRNKKLKGGKLKPYRRFRHTTTPIAVEKTTENLTTTEKATTRTVPEPQNSEDTDEIESKPNTARIFKTSDDGTTTVRADTKKAISDAELLTMAKRYCNDIDQNSNEFSFNWCVEKALRRANTLQVSVTKPSQVTNAPKPYADKKEAGNAPKPAENINNDTTLPVYEKMPIRLALTTSTTTTSTLKPSTTVSPYFPDNDELEAKIQEYELPKLPADGTVFWDASVHASQYQFPDDQTDNDGASDHMPGDDDISDALIDPAVLELRAKKRAYVRQLNKAILNSKGRKPIGK